MRLGFGITSSDAAPGLLRQRRNTEFFWEQELINGTIVRVGMVFLQQSQGIPGQILDVTVARGELSC